MPRPPHAEPGRKAHGGARVSGRGLPAGTPLRAIRVAVLRAAGVRAGRGVCAVCAPCVRRVAGARWRWPTIPRVSNPLPVQLARLRDPIVAITTAPGRAAVGMLRLSGADVQSVVQAITGRALMPRHAHHLPLRDADGAAIDHGLAIHFPAPHSYTGEDVLELHAHGGPVVLRLLLARCLQAGAGIGLRLAEPGEFTLRAYLNGKLDLAQAEAVADLIDAATDAAARSATRALAGAFSQAAQALAARTVQLRLLVEATLDFPEEEVDFLERADAQGQLDALRTDVAALLASAQQGALLRDGLTVVLAGQPNAGKSALLNALAGADVAIVSPHAGTTRDRVSQALQIDGVPLHIIDTAGLRDPGAASDEVERIGIARTWEALAQADAVLLLHDLSRAGDAAHAQADAAIAAGLRERAPGLAPSRILHVHTKRDLAPHAAVPTGALAIAAPIGQGLPELRQALLALAGWQPSQESAPIARERHLHALRQTQAELTLAAEHLALGNATLELLAEHLRQAHQALQALTGHHSADDLLGDIFGRFCIGK